MKRARVVQLLLLPVVSSVVAGGVAAAPAAALSPSVTTKAATGVTGFAGTLNGLVNPNGLETKTYFEYGKTTAYGSKTAEVNAGSGSSTTEVTKAISELAPNTTYHYRIIATNADGTGTGGDQSFKTLAAPQVATQSASGITWECATLKGSVTLNGAPANYQFQYGTTTSYGSTIPVSPKEVSSSGTVEEVACGLKPNTLYHYRITAENSFGSAQGTDMSFTTLSAVTLSAKGTALTAGAALKVFSSNFTFNGEFVEHSCEETEFTGEVSENPGALETVTAAKMQNAGGASCNYAPYPIGGKEKYSISGKPMLEYTIKGGEGIMRTSTFTLLGILNLIDIECEYHVELSGTYSFGGELNLIHMTGTAVPFHEQTTKGEPVEGVCETETLSGNFTVTSSGNSVVASH